jgi:hypothetical protein
MMLWPASISCSGAVGDMRTVVSYGGRRPDCNIDECISPGGAKGI